MVRGMRVWFRSGWYIPGVYTAPIAVRKVPQLSRNPMTTNLYLKEQTKNGFSRAH